MKLTAKQLLVIAFFIFLAFLLLACADEPQQDTVGCVTQENETTHEIIRIGQMTYRQFGGAYFVKVPGFNHPKFKAGPC